MMTETPNSWERPLIYATSDTHGQLLKELPVCDIFLHAGDICPDYIQNTKFQSCLMRKNPDLLLGWFRSWCEAIDRQHRCRSIVFTWGNHDWTEYLGDEISQILCDFPNFHLLVDEMVEIDGVKIWGTPWSNTFYRWAWMDTEESLGIHRYAKIPEGIDIILSHQPPLGFGGTMWDPQHRWKEEIGSWSLLDNIRRTAPDVVVCGHIHEGFGRWSIPESKIVVYNVAKLDGNYRDVNPFVRVDLPEKVG